ncbi:MAG: tRNA dihydrouridine(20/20a) synthase DusA [Burkholderiaceae bacterium]
MVPPSAHAFCVAPMVDLTDRHCRYFHRLLSRHARLYTEMLSTKAVLLGDRARVLDFDAAEHPVALQLGGSDPAELAAAARVGVDHGYDEINLNCGCPSERVQQGAFGACLMAEPARVAECVLAMREAVDVPVTVKHRIGIGRNESYGFVRDFVGTVARAGCEVFIVHARNAWLEGLSPKDNRTIPPLRYEIVHRLKADFPALRFVLNGGLRELETAGVASRGLDGVMLGRAAYENPWLLAGVDAACFGADGPAPVRPEVAMAMRDYARERLREGVALRAVTRHMLGLFNGLPGARRWRRSLSDVALLRNDDPDIIARALDMVGGHDTNRVGEPAVTI